MGEKPIASVRMCIMDMENAIEIPVDSDIHAFFESLSDFLIKISEIMIRQEVANAV